MSCQKSKQENYFGRKFIQRRRRVQQHYIKQIICAAKFKRFHPGMRAHIF